MSLFSAACAAATTGILHALGRRSGLDPVSALFSSLLLAFSPSFWGEANVQRVYSLNALFVALTTAIALSWHHSRNPRLLLLLFFFSGLGATNHTFMVIYGVALAAFALMSEPGLIAKPRDIFLAAASFGAGLLPYLYLPLRSRADPPLDWGNPERVTGLLRVILRWDFWERAWIESPADFLVIAGDYLLGLGRELLGAGAILALVGAVAGRRRGWPVALALLVMAGNLLSMALHGSRSDIFLWHRYYIPSYLMAAMLAGVGCHELLKRLPRGARFLPLAVPALALVMNWSSFDRSRYRIAEDFSRTLLETLPPGAHLSATDDNILFVLIYLHFVERLRPDVDLILEGVGEADLSPLKFNPDTDPLFFTHHPNWSIQGLEIVPVGLVFQTVRPGRPGLSPVVSKTELEGEHDPRVPKDYLTQNLIGQFHFMLGSTFEARDWARAAKELEAAQKAAPDNDVLFYNLGLIYRRNGLFDEALAAFERSQEINPRHLASKDRVRAEDRVLEVSAELERLTKIEGSLTLEPGTAKGTVAYHARMAQLLNERGETLAARGHWLRAAQSPK
jgi:tetratricopeptide (TPR) repeat protein